VWIRPQRKNSCLVVGQNKLGYTSSLSGPAAGSRSLILHVTSSHPNSSDAQPLESWAFLPFHTVGQSPGRTLALETTSLSNIVLIWSGDDKLGLPTWRRTGSPKCCIKTPPAVQRGSLWCCQNKCVVPEALVALGPCEEFVPVGVITTTLETNVGADYHDMTGMINQNTPCASSLQSGNSRRLPAPSILDNPSAASLSQQLKRRVVKMPLLGNTDPPCDFVSPPQMQKRPSSTSLEHIRLVSQIGCVTFVNRILVHM
jgi:hypothetical protein